ncbi:MAG: outer membrane beta-barrel domain-containing protein, partial [Pseudobdellovibrionaceae bacterium]
MKKLASLVTAVLILSTLSVQAQNSKDKKDAKASAPAAPTTPAAAEDRGSDKMDIKSLEKKYWSAKDDDFQVVQNRAYSKAGRGFFSVMYGNLINDPFTVGSGTGLAGGYYFTEQWGLELSHITTSLKNNDSTKEFQSRFAVSPNYNMTKSITTLSGHWMPIYGKISLLDTRIIYFDMGFGFGLGTTSYEKQSSGDDEKVSASHYSLDVIQNYFFSQMFAL